MITQRPTEEMIAQWKAVWRENKDRLSPNRKTGPQVLEYLQKRYPLTELSDPEALKAIACDVTMNEYWAEKLPAGTAPSPRAFYLENEGAGRRFYLPENRDDPELWGGSVERIFVGVDLASGFYMVEGSTLLWDELRAFQGLDEKDLQNFVMVAQYLEAQERMNRTGGSPLT
ncbi:hypothetical protein [Candidatus Allofournierella merdipullorum]|uniref:hypothetical protein n=1 Tax=Candidatus Allofournierella merdipullorum TaxID=2838595 RepID=UPI00374F1C8C